MELALKTGSLLAIIIGAYAAKRAGFFREKDYRVLSMFVFNATLPAAVIRSFAMNDHDLSLFWLVLLGFLASCLPLFIIFAATQGDTVEHRAFQMLCGTTFNIGNFTLPVVITFLGPAAGIPVVMFDMGNAVMCSAGSLVCTNALLRLGGQTHGPAGNGTRAPALCATDDGNDAPATPPRGRIRSVLRNFYTSAAFDTYVVMIIMLLAGIEIPEGVITVIDPLANANTFCSMAMVGLMMDVPDNRDDRVQMLKVLGWRLGVAAIGSSIVWLALPVAPRIRSIAVICMFAPIAVFATKFTDMTLGKAKLAGFALTVSAVCSLLIMAALATVLPT